ncbi:MAG: glutamine-hydrolyzing GMP synthase [Nanobdellota archaeon]
MEKIVILDFGGQYTQLIAKCVRETNVFSEIIPHFESGRINKENLKGVILSGGPSSVTMKGSPKIEKSFFKLGVPILGICYGMQTIAYLMGGELVNQGVKEYGETEIKLEKSNLFSGIGSNQIKVWMSHGDSVSNPPKGFKTIAETKNHIAAIANKEKQIYGVQFHPEVAHTEHGTDIINNFVHNICKCKHDWTPGNFVEKAKKYIKDTVKNNDVICFVSGGVDSSFVAALLSKTNGIGNVYPVYIQGLMRKHETREVEKSLKEAGVDNLLVYKAEDEFIEAVYGLSGPEEKRKAIGNLFGKLQQRIVNDLNLGKNTYLAQGTLYTDLIESGKGVGNSANNIKSHHNVGCEFIEDLKKKRQLVEPNKWIFKDEVRKAAKEIGLPENIYNRQPFPGPGLGIRIVNGKSEWEDTCKEEQKKAEPIAKKHNLRIVVAPVKTVGVQGDKRTYKFVAVLRGEKNWQKIREAAKEIPMECNNINRVVFQIDESDTQPRAIKTIVSKKTINTLKEIDYQGRNMLSDSGISQTIFVLFGADLSGEGKRSVALRAVLTDDFMTARPAVPGNEINWETLDKINSIVKKYSGSLVIDVTDKPPATTCWE